ncbi:MAG: tetratricopeptide repeat protein [Deltaproteobacteria bacterium]|nr:tetratricopeptide repeat protein [Deltaproteobacteria bacterium]
MNIRNRRWMLVGMASLTGSFLLLQWGCSAMNSFFEGTPSGSAVLNSTVAEKDMNQFISQFRPNYGNPDSHYLLGCYYQERGKHPEAITEFKKTLILNPQYVKAYNGIGVSYDLSGDFLKASAFYQEALKLNPNLDYVYNNMGYSFLLQGRPDEAVSAFQKAIALNDRNERYHSNLALAYAEKGDHDLAFAEFAQAGGKAQGHYHLANFLYGKGSFEKAREHYRVAIRLDPSLQDAKIRLEATESLSRITLSVSSPQSAPPPLQLALPGPDAKNDLEIPPGKAVHPLEEKYFNESTNTGQAFRENDWTPAQPVPIEVSNGNGISRMAKAVGAFLKEKNFKIARLTNADTFDHTGSRVYYRQGYLETARKIERKIPIVLKMEEIKKLDRPDLKVKILIGKDMIPHRKIFFKGDRTS